MNLSLCLMTLGLSEDIWCHEWDTLFYACKSPDQSKKITVKWVVRLMIADGHLIFPRGLCGYVWVNILILSPLRVNGTNEKTALPVVAVVL